MWVGWTRRVSLGKRYGTLKDDWGVRKKDGRYKPKNKT